jgi:hypothetical protein
VVKETDRHDKAEFCWNGTNPIYFVLVNIAQAIFWQYAEL